MEPVLLALGQPANLSKEVQIFLRVLIFGAPGYIGFESLKKYLQVNFEFHLWLLSLLTFLSSLSVKVSIAGSHYYILRAEKNYQGS